MRDDDERGAGARRSSTQPEVRGGAKCGGFLGKEWGGPVAPGGPGGGENTAARRPSQSLLIGGNGEK